jgi:hypothetical protein
MKKKIVGYEEKLPRVYPPFKGDTYGQFFQTSDGRLFRLITSLNYDLSVNYSLCEIHLEDVP